MNALQGVVDKMDELLGLFDEIVQEAVVVDNEDMAKFTHFMDRAEQLSGDFNRYNGVINHKK